MTMAEQQGFDWSARVRTTASEAMRYSRFVVRMKKILAAGAFLTIFAVLAFFFFERQPRGLQLAYEKLGRIENDLTMMKPRLTGSDVKGNPFVITADRAVQDAHDPNKATLSNLEADMTLEKGQWLNARAKRGMVDMGSGQLELAGGIDVYSGNGYELHSASASANLKQSVIHGHETVTGQGPDGTLRADSFHADRSTNLLTLTGHVQMTVLGTAK